ncbi:hypothetical protein HOS55_gp098 [Pseudomonas phage PMBT3]|uniref:Uncharacterized protein n=1 Tax=Pseudomonas phage PMBT3 TaxID=2059856 RepID=A0A2I6PI09_9CAUD|nr:hypothetical protein HOS55_gp098 [Pseudomonas phage PMBT3]AUM59700.1 hypothetical protein [Pseudomonas phage PMBT3]
MYTGDKAQIERVRAASAELKKVLQTLADELGTTPEEINKLLLRRAMRRKGASPMRPLRIVTLAQLALMPAGTLISPINIVPYVDDENRKMMDFDIQGTLQLKPMSRLVGQDEHWLVTIDILPDVRVVDGRIEYNVSEHSYTIPNDFHPHRFVVWEETDDVALQRLLAEGH